MPITYVNPARKARKVRRKLFGAALKSYKKKHGRKKLYGAALAARQAKRARRNGGKWTHKRRIRMHMRKQIRKQIRAHGPKKLYGAALAAHQAKQNPARKRRKKVSSAATRRARKKSTNQGMAMAKSRKKRHRRAATSKPRRKRAKGGHRKSSKRVRAARKAARTRAAKKARRSAAARKAARSRKRGGGRGRKRSHKRSHRRARRARGRKSFRARRIKLTLTANPRKRRRRKHRRNPRPTTQGSLLRARRAIRNRYKTPLARATRRRYRMRSNPSFGGGLKGILSGFITVVKEAAPVAIALYGSRAASMQLAPRLPGFNRIPAAAQGPVMAGLMILGGHLLTKHVKFLGKYRMGVMVGTGVNLFDQVVSAVAPANVKSMFGLAGYSDMYATGLGEYVSMGDYIEMGGAPPIDDDITLGEYVSMGLDEDLGLSEELGVEEDLGGALDRSWLGGVSQDSMLRQVPTQRLIAPVPMRSFTKQIGAAGPGYDKADALYGGIFAGGY